MKTIIISGNDTNVGKTWVMRTLVAFLAQRGKTVQVIKPVETGVEPKEYLGDGLFSIQGLNPENIKQETFFSMPEPVAPEYAAKNLAIEIRLEDIVQRIGNLPHADYRLIEGAGGITVPLGTDGKNITDLFKKIHANFIVLVLENRIGVMNQAKLLEEYAKKKNIPCGYWLNEVQPQEERLTETNLDFIDKLHFPLWTFQRHGESKINSLPSIFL